MNSPRLGVVGGLGPLATVDFLDKLVRLTPATRDQDHIPWVVVGIPQTPDRTQCILRNDDAPFAHLLGAVEMLNRQQVATIAIICNTAHYWHARLQAHSQAPILHIADAAVRGLRGLAGGSRVGILSTRGTLLAGFYQQRLIDAGHGPVLPADTGAQEDVDLCIRLVKANDVAAAASCFGKAVRSCLDAGCSAVIMACTEIPIAQQAASGPLGLTAVDANLELARLCVERLYDERSLKDAGTAG
jgi:aspartate racemase